MWNKLIVTSFEYRISICLVGLRKTTKNLKLAGLCAKN